MTSAASRALRPRGVLGSDYEPNEVLVAACIALSVPVWSAVLLSMSDLDKQANAVSIAPGDAVPMRVNPVVDLDSPLLKLGGKKVRAELPAKWRKPEPTKTVRERQAIVSTKAQDDPDAAPPGHLTVSDSGKPIDPDAEVVAQADEPNEDVPDASLEGAGGGSPAGSKEGTEVDPLKARAASLYHGRISAFLYGGWSCPQGAQAGCTASAGVSLSGGVVSGVSFRGCGDPTLDTAARAHIQGKVGQSIPPPPENYPELAPNSFNVTYVCK